MRRLRYASRATRICSCRSSMRAFSERIASETVSNVAVGFPPIAPPGASGSSFPSWSSRAAVSASRAASRPSAARTAVACHAVKRGGGDAGDRDAEHPEPARRSRRPSCRRDQPQRGHRQNRDDRHPPQRLDPAHAQFVTPGVVMPGVMRGRLLRDPGRCARVRRARPRRANRTARASRRAATASRPTRSSARSAGPSA